MISYIPDNQVDEKFDQELRELLVTCFTKEPAFKKHRYFKELAQHRWYIREKKLIAHLALHEKVFTNANKHYKFGGVADVCVHPDFRGRGYVKHLVQTAHNWLKTQNYPFAILFGEAYIYHSSGYINISNDIRYLDDIANEWTIKKIKSAMVCEIGSLQWPPGLIDINGPMF